MGILHECTSIYPHSQSPLPRVQEDKNIRSIFTSIFLLLFRFTPSLGWICSLFLYSAKKRRRFLPFCVVKRASVGALIVQGKDLSVASEQKGTSW